MSSDRKRYWREAKRRSRAKAGFQGFIKEYTHRGVFITPDQYVALLDTHGGKCAICTNPFQGTPFLDHDHKTGKVRGFLCSACNSALGLFADDTKRLQAAIRYLKRAAK